MGQPMDDLSWVKGVAPLIADGLLRGKVISQTDLQRVIDIIVDELFARLCVGDRPIQPE